jgi:hypothetical protein
MKPAAAFIPRILWPAGTGSYGGSFQVPSRTVRDQTDRGLEVYDGMSSVFEADAWVPTSREDVEPAGTLFQEFGAVLPARTLEGWAVAMRITKHDQSYIVVIAPRGAYGLLTWLMHCSGCLQLSMMSEK